MSGRKTEIEPAYRLKIPGILLKDDHPNSDGWHPFLMRTNELLELHQAIKDALGLEQQ